MKRYGNPLPSSGISEDELAYQHGRSVIVIYGGGGVRFDPSSKPTERPPKRKTFDLLSLLRFRRNQTVVK